MKKKKVNLRDLKPNSEVQHTHNDGHNHGNGSAFKTYVPAIISFTMLKMKDYQRKIFLEKIF
mgnify:CR=1 FL=1